MKMYSLLTKLFFAGILISILPLLIYQYISFEQSSKTLQLTYSKELKHKTELTTLLTNQAISHNTSDLNIIANGISEWIRLKKFDVIKSQFSSFIQKSYDLNFISLLDKDKNLIVSTNSEDECTNYIKDVKKVLNRYISLNTSETIVSELIIKDDIGSILLVKKVTDYDYYVVINMNIQVIELLMSNFEDEVAGDIPVRIVDKNNLIVFSSDDKNKNVKYSDIHKFNSDNEIEKGIYNFTNSNNQEVISSYDEIHNFGLDNALGWKIIASIPTAVIEEDVNKSLSPMKKVGLFIVFITLLILGILSRSIVKSIRKVVDVANKISGGDYTARVLDKNSTTEFNTLALALNSMASKIENRTYKLEEQKLLLENLAHYDALTHIPNRLLFKQRIEEAIVHAKKHNTKFALLYIDIDEFKDINDSFGHDVGDEILKAVVARISKVLKNTDTFARLGGDEFTIILENLVDVESISAIADRIIDTVKKTIAIKDNTFKVSISIGISIYPDNATSKSELIKYSDIAMYKAKALGKDNYQFYADEMSQYSIQRIIMKQKLEHAIENNQFEVYYQAQLNKRTNKYIGMEALIRWKHPEDGFIPPNEFLPLAEEMGIIIDIDQFVMKTAMRQMASWYEKSYNPGRVSLNLSIRHLQNDGFLTSLIKNLEDTGCKPEWIELEVTESQIMSNYDESISKLNEINKLGIKVSIDDFGTGYSSLAYLKHLPIDKLKIDKSFVDDVPRDLEDVAITKAIIALCKSLNLTVIAEGVERDEQSQLLMENGCDLMQGYLYSRPVDAKSYEEKFFKDKED